MPKRLAILVLTGLALLLAVGAAADPAAEQASVDGRITALESEIQAAMQREDVLTTDIAAASERIDIVGGEVEELGARVARLRAELARHRGRLAALRALYAEQTQRLVLLERTARVAQARLEDRLVEIYTGNEPDELEILFLVSSLNDLITQLEYLQQVAARDREIAEDVSESRGRVDREREQTAATKRAEAETTAALAARTSEVEAAYGTLLARRDQLLAAQADRRSLLETVRAARGASEEDLAVLERTSAELEERIRSSSAAPGAITTPPAASPSGFAWPVNGPITSGFGLRWGRLHAGVDIGVGFGTTIRAAAAGVVSYAGWLGGYGNLVVVDHGGGISTAYAHQQQIYVSVGTAVAQGQALGEVGSTGNSTGPHLHFEVRLGGQAVDPLGYL